MSKYGYISLDMLYEYAMNTVDKTVSPNEFMRMSRANVIPIEWIEKYADSTLDGGNSQMPGFKAAIIKEMVDEWEKRKWNRC